MMRLLRLLPVALFTTNLWIVQVPAAYAASPTIASLSPSSTAAGGETFTLTINGANFTSGATAKWDATALATISKSPTQLMATVPAKLISAAGKASITVKDAVGTSAPSTFTIDLPATAVPTFSPGAGHYDSAQTVRIGGTTNGSAIYYTTDGSTPTTGSMRFKLPIAVGVGPPRTLKAIATAPGYSISPVATAVYTITQPAAVPTISVTSGTYTTAQLVTIGDTTVNATIFYTVDGTTPTSKSTQYKSAILVSGTETLKAIAEAPWHLPSPVDEANYVFAPLAATPTFSLKAGTYTSAQAVTIKDSTPGATIYYTTDGAPPTAGSKYTAPIAVSATEKLQAIATAPGYSLSSPATAAYAITLPADFSISAASPSVALWRGENENVAIGVTGVNGFKSSVSITVSGLPAGVIASPTAFSLAPGNKRQVKLTVATTAKLGKYSITFQGKSGSLSHRAQTSLSVIDAVTEVHPRLRTRYLRTDSYYDLSYAMEHFTAYDPVHRQFFVSNPFMNRIDVFDAEQEIEIAQIAVQGPWGIDISPYNGSLYAGTMIGDVYQVDTATLTVTQRYPAASIGPDGFEAAEALVLSDGRLFLQGAYSVVSSEDGYLGDVVWDPVTNSMDSGPTNAPYVCYPYGGWAATVTGDRTRIVFGSGSFGDDVCSYDPIARKATAGKLPIPAGYSPGPLISAPTGTVVYAINPVQVVAFDAVTLKVLAENRGPISYLGNPLFLQSGVVSLDGKTLYLSQAAQGTGYYQTVALDTSTLTPVGWIPSYLVADLQGSVVAGAIDETGLIAGPIGHGVGFLDATLMRAKPSTYMQGLFTEPTTGPLAGSTAVDKFAVADVTDGARLSQVFIGNGPGLHLSFNASENEGNTAKAYTPPSSLAGAVDVTATLSDGAISVTPEGFSYGPTILEMVPNGATAEGGQTGTIIGYGFSNTLAENEVTIGGRPAVATSVQTTPWIDPYPFNTNELQFTIPPGTAGTAADVTVRTPSGSITAEGAFHYTAATETYPLKANLQEGIYDARRDLYYFADQAKIQILSKRQGKWLTPISLPGVVAGTQLAGVAESPDGTKLAVSDMGGNAIYVLDPDSPASPKRYPMPIRYGYPSPESPTGLAITNTGMVYFVAINGAVAPFHKLDTSTRAVTDIGADFIDPSSLYWHVYLSPDSSRVYTNVGLVYCIDTASDQVSEPFSFPAAEGPEESKAIPEMSISGDGSTLEVSSFFTDRSLNALNEPFYIDWETWFPIAVSGQKLNHDGSILFQPLTDGIDLLARNTGRLLYRVQIPVTPANVWDPLVLGKGQNVLAVITASGVSIVDMSSLPIAAEYREPFPDATQPETGDFASMRNVGIARRPHPKRPAHSTGPQKLRRSAVARQQATGALRNGP
jgi:hypothetical protein